jgi:predicted amidophosphoribosyltransferase
MEQKRDAPEPKPYKQNGTFRCCPWCHTPVDMADQFCPHCGHRADLPRQECTCIKCQLTRPRFKT